MITCRQASELVTEFLEGEMVFSRRLRFKLHLILCPNCKKHLKKMEHLIHSMGHIPDNTEIPEELLERLTRFTANR